MELNHHTSAEIIEYVLVTPYLYDDDGTMTEYWYQNERGIRSAINYYKNVGYLSLYDRDDAGNIIRIEQKRPYKYFLTVLGQTHSQNPWIKKDHREQRISDEAYRLFEELLLDEPAFREAVREYATTHQLPKLNVTRTRAPIFRNPKVRMGKGGKITIVNEDNTEREITTEELQATLLKVDGIRIKEQEHKSVLITQQMQMQGYEQQISDLVYALEGKEITISDIKRRNTGAMRVAQRKDLVYAVSGINADELEGELPVEVPVGAYFIEAWGGSIWGRKVKGATLFNRSSFELMGDFNPEIIWRGHARNEMSYDEMDGVGMYISKIRPTGITIDAVNSRMTKTAALKW